MARILAYGFILGTIDRTSSTIKPMDTTPIESMIAELCIDESADSELNDLLAVVAEREGVMAEPEDLAAA